MEWQDVLAELVAFVQGAAPVIWESCVRQAVMTGIQNLLWAVIVLGGLVTCLRLRPLFLKKHLEVLKSKEGRHSEGWWGYRYDNEYKVLAIWCMVGAAILAIFFVGIMNGAIARLINPDYYAIQLLLRYVQ